MSHDALLTAFILAQPGAIESSERQGQKVLVEETLIPKTITNGSLADLLRWGFVLIQESVDELFHKMKLPDGWTLVATDHAMYSVIKDSEGVCRADIFYKAAFYDRRADLRLTPRYQVSASEVTVTGLRLSVVDTKTKTKVKTFSSKGENLDLRKKAYDWLDKTYPEHRNPVAYWE